MDGYTYYDKADKSVVDKCSRVLKLMRTWEGDNKMDRNAITLKHREMV